MKGTSPPYLVSVEINLLMIHPITKEKTSQGQFTFAIQRNDETAQVLILRPGSPPVSSFPLTNKTNWNLQKDNIVSMNDSHGKQKLIQFSNATDAMFATSAIGFCYMTISDSEISKYEILQEKDPRVVGPGDKMKLTYYCYPVIESKIGKCCSYKEEGKINLDSSALPVGMVNGITGMTVNSQRVIYVPKSCSATISGGHDSKYPNQNLLIYAHLLAVRFSDDHNSSHSPEPEPQPAKPVETVEQPPPKTSPPPVEPVPSSKPPTPKPTPVPSVPAPAPQRSSEVYERLAAIESKLALLDLSDTDQQSLVGGIVNLSAQVRSKQREIDTLKKAPAAAAPPPMSANRKLDEAVKETEDLRRKLGAAERRIAELEKQSPSAPGGDAKPKVEALIKKMMSDVYNDVTDQFKDDEQYEGSSIADQLFSLMRKHSYEAFNSLTS